MPRVLTAMVVGAGLAVAGATFQGLVRNPLADPYVLGTASGAALGAAIAVLHPGPARRGRVRPAPRARVRRRARDGVPRASRRRLGRGRGPHPAAAHGLRGRLGPGGGADDGDVRVGLEPAPDLLVPARRSRRVLVDPARRRRAADPRGVPGPRAARPGPRRVPARGHGGQPPRARRPARATDPPRHSRRWRPPPPWRSAGSSASSGSSCRTSSACWSGRRRAGVVPLSALVGAVLLVRRRPRRAARRRHPGRGRHGAHRRARSSCSCSPARVPGTSCDRRTDPVARSG